MSTEQSTNSSLVCLYDLQRNVKEQQKNPKTLLPFLALRVQYLLKKNNHWLNLTSFESNVNDALYVEKLDEESWCILFRSWQFFVRSAYLHLCVIKRLIIIQETCNHCGGKNTMNTRTRWNSNTMKWRGVTQANRKQRKSKLQINTQEFVVSVPPKTAGTF